MPGMLVFTCAQCSTAAQTPQHYVKDGSSIQGCDEVLKENPKAQRNPTSVFFFGLGGVQRKHTEVTGKLLKSTHTGSGPLKLPTNLPYCSALFFHTPVHAVWKKVVGSNQLGSKAC